MGFRVCISDTIRVLGLRGSHVSYTHLRLSPSGGAENLTCVNFLVPKSCFFCVLLVSLFYTFSPVWFFLCHFLDLHFLPSLLSGSVSVSGMPGVQL